MPEAYILTGGNLGDRKRNLQKATALISEEAGKIISKSSVYETEPWGFSHELNFLNQALEIETTLEPLQLLESLLNIERKTGRDRGGTSYSARVIDIDILFYGDRIVKSGRLIIPHPKIHERMFVLAPMAEIAPQFMHPLLDKSISQLKDMCVDTKRVCRLQE